MMRQILISAVLCLALTACGGSGDDLVSQAESPIDAAGLNAQALRVEQPPTNGRLPSDLEPPAAID